MCYKIFVASAAIILPLEIAAAETVVQKGDVRLPSMATEEAIERLPAFKPEQGSQDKSKFRNFLVKPSDLPDPMGQGLALNADGLASLPFVAPNTMILQFEPEVSESDIQNVLKERELKVVRKYQKIGAVQVEANLEQYFKPELTDSNTNDALIRGMVSAIQSFQNDPRIKAAAPDLILRDQSRRHPSASNVLNASDIRTQDTEVSDWGIGNIEADQLWDQSGARDGAVIGLVDVGFARHQDLVFLGLPKDTDIDDHGNHVAAIACAKHDGRGVRGVLPHCFIRARSGDVFFESNNDGEVLNFFVLFSQILATLERFVESQDDIGTFNVSLGYNWRSNFGINPDLPESAQWRTLVESQGTILVSLLELADKRGKIVFSAAGNDTIAPQTPINAKYASPFNWAAITAREAGIAENGVVVEAHDKSGDRAVFSNTGGHISCPGVDIFSAVAFDEQGVVSDVAYGTMSGTSMASPYCAAGHQLLKLIRPGYSGVEIVDCMRESTEASSSGAPMLRLVDASNACPILN